MKKIECKFCKKVFNTYHKNQKYCGFLCMGNDRKGDKNVMKRPEIVEKNRQSTLKTFANGRIPNMRNKKHTLEARKKMCKSHLGIKLSDYHKKRQSEGQQKGENHHNWKGDNASYYAIHAWIKRQLGTPKKCIHCKTIIAKKFEWANIDHKYRRNIVDWICLCTSCHRKYDFQRRIQRADSREGNHSSDS